MYKVYYYPCKKYMEYEQRLHIVKPRYRSCIYCDGFYISDGYLHTECCKKFGYDGFMKYINFCIPLEMFIRLEKVGG